MTDLGERTSTLVRCRGCSATIRFVRMRSGRSMPVDPEPLHNVWLASGEGDARIALVDAVAGELRGGIPVHGPTDKARLVPLGYVPHWAKCPAAKQFKKRPRKRKKEAR